MKPKLLLSVVGLYLLLILGGSWEVDAYDAIQFKRLKAVGNCPFCDLSDVRLSKVDLKGANLIKVNLSLAYLDNIDLTGANLTKVTVMSSDFIKVNLTGANLTGANLTGANLTGAIMKGVVFCVTIMPDGTTNNSGC